MQPLVLPRILLVQVESFERYACTVAEAAVQVVYYFSKRLTMFYETAGQSGLVELWRALTGEAFDNIVDSYK